MTAPTTLAPTHTNSTLPYIPGSRPLEVGLPAEPPEPEIAPEPTSSSEKSVCAGTTKRGTPCQATPRTVTGLCIFHDPDYKETRLQNAARGGQGFPGPVAIAANELVTAFATRATLQSSFELLFRLELLGKIPLKRSVHLIRILNGAARNLVGAPTPLDGQFPDHRAYHEDSLGELLLCADQIASSLHEAESFANATDNINAGDRLVKLLAAYEDFFPSSASVPEPTSLNRIFNSMSKVPRSP